MRSFGADQHEQLFIKFFRETHFNDFGLSLREPHFRDIPGLTIKVEDKSKLRIGEIQTMNITSNWRRILKITCCESECERLGMTKKINDQ